MCCCDFWVYREYHYLYQVSYFLIFTCVPIIYAKLVKLILLGNFQVTGNSIFQILTHSIWTNWCSFPTSKLHMICPNFNSLSLKFGYKFNFLVDTLSYKHVWRFSARTQIFSCDTWNFMEVLTNTKMTYETLYKL